MHVLVTGGAGYVGSRVTAHLLAKGWTVTVIDSLVYGAAALLPFAGNSAFRLVPADVRDGTAVEAAMRGVDALVHLAAIVGDPACSQDPDLAEKVNRDAAIATLDRAEAAGVKRFIFVSTCSNYGVSDAGVLADEDSELRPLSLYARTKVDVELAALGIARTSTVTVLRFGTICGLSGRMRFDLLVSEMARAAALGESIEVYKPDAWRPFLHVLDAARALEHVLTFAPDRIRQRVFNIVGENYQKRSLVELVLRHFPRASVIVTDAEPDSRDYRVSAERAKHELQFSTEHTVEEAFVDTAKAVSDGVFVDPYWAGHSAIPIRKTNPLLKV